MADRDRQTGKFVAGNPGGPGGFLPGNPGGPGRPRGRRKPWRALQDRRRPPAPKDVDGLIGEWLGAIGKPGGVPAIRALLELLEGP